MKSSLIIALLLFFVSCGKDEKLRVIHNNDRVTLLEKITSLNTTLIQMNTQVIEDLKSRVESLEAKTSQIESDLIAEVEAREAGDEILMDLIEQEAQAREAEDLDLQGQLSVAIANQQLINSQLDIKINNLQNALEASILANSVVNFIQNLRIKALESKVANLINSLGDVSSRLLLVEGDITSLQTTVDAIQSDIQDLKDKDVDLQNQINDLGVRISSTESDTSDLESRFDSLMRRVESLEISQVLQNFVLVNLAFNLNQIKIQMGNMQGDISDLEDIISSLESKIDELQEQLDRLEEDSVTPDELNAAIADLQSQIDDLQGNTGSPSVSGVCSVKKTQDYGSQKDYVFKLNDSTGLVGDFEVVINMSNNFGGITTDNGGPVTFSGGVYTITPINSATQFTLYSKGNGNQYVKSAKVVKISTNQELTCTVDNSI